VPKLFDHPYADFLHEVEKPSRYTGAEHGVRRKDWASVDARVCLAFPDIYDIGMSHLGYRILYEVLNDNARTLAERCYTPWIDMQQKLRDHGEPLRSLESSRPLCDFDVVGFSLQYELTYTNILTMLELGSVPLRSADRGEDDPLIIAGGPVATHAEPMSIFLDAVLIGDGEEATTEIALCWTDAKKAGLSRTERLAKLATIPGVYVPSLYETGVIDEDKTGIEVVTGSRTKNAPFPIERRLLEDLSKFPFPDGGPVGGPEAIFERMSIEVARGCTEGCRFCQAGMIYRPVRERDPNEVIETVERALEKSGQDEVSLAALSTADVSCISPLIKQLVEKTAPERVSLGVASLRAYGLADDLLEDMRKVRASGLTFAPEAGTQRMRDVINKKVTEAQLLETAERVFSKGYDRMKLYFIIGLPTEEDEDVLGIIEVGKNALAAGKKVARGRKPAITVSVSSHIPKPHTPFQWCAQDTIEEIARKQKLLRSAISPYRALKLKVHDSTTSVLEGILARGDRPLGEVIERAYRNGARFDSWEDQLQMDVWHEAFEHYQVETSKYLGTLPVSARLPWDHFDVGLEDGFLAREYRKALRSRLSPPCGKAAGMFIHHDNKQDAEADKRRLVCYDCGVACDLTDMREKRIGFLDEMKAFEPAKPRLPVVPQSETEEDKPVPKRKQRPEDLRPARPGAPPERWRLGFEKTGPLALLGHLDLIRELPRVIRRAGQRIAYTQGFHPKPAFSFSPALSLGSPSLGEALDLKLIEAPAPEVLLEKLNTSCGGGLRFTNAAKLGPLDPGLSKLIDGASYIVAFSTDSLSEIGGPAGLEEKLTAFLALPEAWVMRDVKGIGKRVNVREHVARASLGGDEALQKLEHAGLVGGMTCFVVRMHIAPKGSAKMREVVECVLGRPDFPFKALRLELHTGETTPFDLDAHRKAPKSESTGTDSADDNDDAKRAADADISAA